MIRSPLGVTHRDLGREVFRGAGDLAAIIFAAREGRSARNLLERLNKESEELFKGHRGNRGTRLWVTYGN